MNENIACGPGKAERQEKHMELNNAVNDLDSVLQHLNKLINRVRGPAPPLPVAPGSLEEPKRLQDRPPTLVEVLDLAPESIRSKVEEAHRRIDEIQELLF